MSGDDLVNLMIVLKSGNTMPVCVSRQLAASHIAWWYDSYEAGRRMPWWRFLFHLCGLQRRRPIVWGFNLQTAAGEVFSCGAVDVRQIAALYVNECSTNPYEKLAAAQQSIADALRREMNRGEEWRGQDEDEEENEDEQ